MKIAAVVILYHPQEFVVTNIKTYYDYVDKIFVFDNSETEPLLEKEMQKFSKIQFFHDFENMGIAKRLNTACKLALEEDYEWILTMDQDSCFYENSISMYFNCFKKLTNKASIAMIGTAFSRHRIVNTPNCISVKADKLITSGSLLNLLLYKEIGEFDENLFIDSVDYDYCFRTQIAGYSIIQFPDIYILHTIGNYAYASSIKTLFLFKKKKEIHSPLRIYYMYRNMLFLNKKYKDQDKKFIKEIRGYVISRIKVSILYGRNARQILKYLKAAKSDFKNNKMGKIKHEL